MNKRYSDIYGISRWGIYIPRVNSLTIQPTGYATRPGSPTGYATRSGSPVNLDNSCIRGAPSFTPFLISKWAFEMRFINNSS